MENDFTIELLFARNRFSENWILVAMREFFCEYF